MKHVVYFITNVVNGKMYVGYTNNLERRWEDHLDKFYMGHKNSLYSAMRKHGVQHFSINEMEVYESKESGLAGEVKWIKELREIGHELYNMTNGGECGSTIPADHVGCRKKAMLKNLNYDNSDPDPMI